MGYIPKRDYIKPSDYTTHKNPEGKDYGTSKYEDDEVEQKYHDTEKEALLYKIANRAPRMEDMEEEKEPISQINIVQKATDIMRDDNDDVRELKMNSQKIVGNLFDRVKFIEMRIQELEEALETRNNINKEIIKDIEDDIMDKESFAGKCCDLDDQRSIKLHISMLRQQKRKELVQYFHDRLTIMTEVRTLKEELESERKITSLFEGAA